VKLRPVSARYDFYLIVAVAAVFAASLVIGLVRHRTGSFFVFTGVCAVIAALASLFILSGRK
jgi:hypothetical protein